MKRTTHRHCLKSSHATEPALRQCSAQLTQSHFNAKCMQCAVIWYRHEIPSKIGKKITLYNTHVWNLPCSAPCIIIVWGFSIFSRLFIDKFVPEITEISFAFELWVAWFITEPSQQIADLPISYTVFRSGNIGDALVHNTSILVLWPFTCLHVKRTANH